MYYRIERTYLTDADGHSDRQYDLAPYMVSAADSASAAVAFLEGEDGQVLGEIAQFAGDRAVVTGMIGRRVCVLFSQRAAETIRPDEQKTVLPPEPSDDDPNERILPKD